MECTDDRTLYEQIRQVSDAMWEYYTTEPNHPGRPWAQDHRHKRVIPADEQTTQGIILQLEGGAPRRIITAFGTWPHIGLSHRLNQSQLDQLLIGTLLHQHRIILAAYHDTPDLLAVMRAGMYTMPAPAIADRHQRRTGGLARWVALTATWQQRQPV